MEITRVRLRFLTHPHVCGIILPIHLCQKLQLRPRQKITVMLGKKEVVATVLQDRRNPDSSIVKVTSLLRSELGIPHGGLINLKREGEVLRLGPAIGIVTTGIRRDPRQPIGQRTSFFHKLLLAQEGKGVFYFIFSPHDVDWHNHTVSAWFLRKNSKGSFVWRRLTTAMPDVVYDRIPSRSAEKHEAVQEFKYKLASYPHLPVFNQGFFNKWSVHQLLYPNPDVNEHIPETYTAPSLQTVRNLLRKYPIVYLKPKNGSLGYGIVKVVRQPGKGYEASYHTGNGNVKRHFTKLASLYQHVFRTRRIRNYLAQQGIPLMTFHGRPFDFRVHLHKNQLNEWVVSCTAAKVAGSGSVTTHVRTGGTVIPGDELLSHLFGRQKAIITERIKQASIRLATAIEQAKGTDLGELGLDMGIDTRGHVWMFEANSKPGRSIFKHARLKHADQESRRLLVDYSCYLANFLIDVRHRFFQEGGTPMPQLRSGWLTVLPSGKWYIQLPRQAKLKLGRKPLTASLGPFSQPKRLYSGLPSQQPGRFRTRINWKMSSNTLRIGPILGILTVGDGVSFVGNRDNFKDICLSGKKWGALVYVFTPHGINWEKKRIRGFLYNDREQIWQPVMMPFPHVVYNRIPTRKAERQPKVRNTLEKIAQLANVTLFNRRFFDKQELFTILEEFPDICPYLPDTKKLDSPARFRHFCSEHQFVYLKPVRGKAGEGIMRIEYKNKAWRVQRLKEQKAITRRFSNLDDLWRYVRGHVRQKRYIMQKGIRRARYQGKPFDLRVLVQKNGEGEWGVTGVGIRRAGAQSITTHVPRGGSIHSLASVLQALFPDDPKKMEATIHQTALSIARALHQKSKDLAEMSMDLGLTEEGNIWFFEANAKPEKFDEPTIRRHSLSNLIHYAQYVSRLQGGHGAQAG